MVIACTRVSTAPQALQYGQKTQVDDLERYAAAQGYTIGQWIHETQSGADELEDREAVQQYFQAAKRHKNAVFLFPRVNRLGRRSELILTIARRLLALGATVNVLGVPGDIATPEGWFTFTMLAGQAEYEYRSDNTTLAKGKLKKAKMGLWAHGRPPHGYRVQRDERGYSTYLEVDEAKAPVYREIFALGEQHGSETTASLIYQKYGMMFSSARIQQIWKNPTYKGMAKITLQGEVVYIQCPPLVNTAQWQLVNDKLRSRARDREGNRAFEKSVLTGFVRCGECGSGAARAKSYVRRTAPQQGYYYRCVYASKTASHNLPNCTHSKMYDSRKLEPHCWQLFCDTITQPTVLERLMQPAPQEQDTAHQVAVLDLESKLARAWQPYTDGRISYEVAQLMAQPIADELEALKRQAKKPVPESNIPAVQLVAVASKMLENAVTLEQRRELLALFSTRFFVSPNGVRIQIKVPLLEGANYA